MGLINSRFLTREQLQRCCRNEISPAVVGYTLLTADGKRIGTVSGILVDDESIEIRYLIADTTTAEFPISQSRILLSPDLGPLERKRKTIHTRLTVDQVQSAPAYEPAVDLVTAYEETAYMDFGDRPSGVADH